MEIVFVSTMSLEGLRSTVGHLNGAIERNLNGEEELRGCPLYEAEMSFRYLYTELDALQKTLIKEINLDNNLRDMTDSIMGMFPGALSDGDKVLESKKADLAKQVLIIGAKIMGVLAAEDSLLDHTVKYARQIRVKSAGALFSEIESDSTNETETESECDTNSKESKARKKLGQLYKSETGKDLRPLKNLVDYRNHRVHVGHLYVTVDKEKKTVIYCTALNIVREKEPKHRFDSQELEHHLLELMEYLKWWCKKVQDYFTSIGQE